MTNDENISPKMTIDGICLENEGKLNNITAGSFQNGELSYTLAKETDVAGYGQFFSAAAAKQLINSHWGDLRAQVKNSSNNLNAKDAFKKVVAADIGKEVLLMILSQKGCEGIRFYYAKKMCKCGKKGGEIGEQTLVAVGIDKNRNDIGAYSISAPNKKHASIMQSDTELSNSSIFCAECSPPKMVDIGEEEHHFTKLFNSFNSFIG